ncbi:hypothetical protein SAMN04489761_3502 [Tenacibaculum sp. MAR_2009_124]|nr:hypothetical protein [Tenacibaculum sp. MAR_2009_124]SEC76194.1 hypothetical protein SAMN04489761_3502 [Tenacibaculum sp. MAR_2009_124]
MIKSPNGFAVFVIVGFNKEHQENIKKIDVFNDLIRIDTDVEKYLYLCENNVEKLQQVLALFKKEIFEVEEGENYSFSIKSFLPRSRANER